MNLEDLDLAPDENEDDSGGEAQTDVGGQGGGSNPSGD